MEAMKVAVVTGGRFHSFDQARQLARRGAFAGIFTGFPRSKVANEGLPADLVHPHPIFQPLVHLGGRLGLPPALRQEVEWRAAESIDRYAARHLPPCDALIALSTGGLRSGRVAQERGGVYVCDRGSTHIRYQDEILREEYTRCGVPYTPIDPRKVRKEEAEYAQADGILVPTAFVARTFADKGVPPEKMCRALYGVDLSRFSPTGAPPDDAFEVIFVGQLSIRKGIRYLLDAFERLDHPKKRLTLVGGPTAETAEIVAKAVATGKVATTGSISRDEVRDRMSRSHVLVLPSIEDGMGMVQTQAMACGCPVIATRNTGCEEIFDDGVEGFAVDMRDADAILARLERLASEPGLRDAMGEAARARVARIGGWHAYGDAVFGHLVRLTGRHG